MNGDRQQRPLPGPRPAPTLHNQYYGTYIWRGQSNVKVGCGPASCWWSARHEARSLRYRMLWSPQRCHCTWSSPLTAVSPQENVARPSGAHVIS